MSKGKRKSKPKPEEPTSSVKKSVVKQPISHSSLVAENTSPRTFQQWIWSWVVVGGIILFIFAGGITFMTSAHPYLGDLSFLIGGVLFLFKFLTWKVLRNHQRRKVIQTLTIIISFFVMAIAIWGNHRLNQEHSKIVVSPYEVTVRGRTDKNFVLTITNNQDFAIYNVNLSICLSYPVHDFSWVKIEPMEKGKEFMPGIPVSMCAVGLSNGCKGIVFDKIAGHATKEFYVIIEGQKLNAEARVAFRVYNWYREPYFESTSINKDYVSKGLPKNFNEVFDDKSKQSNKTGHAYLFKMKMPRNPFFSEDEDDQKEYWCSAFTDF